MRFRRDYLARDYTKLVIEQGLGNIDAPEPYRPLIEAHSFSSKGTRSVIPADGTLVHVLSGGEYDAYVLYQADPNITRIWTQVALHPAATQRIAIELRIKHPSTRDGDLIMSTDFVIDSHVSGKTERIAVSYKRRSDLTTRHLDKAKIESIYWRERRVTWRLLLDTDLPVTRIANLKLISRFRSGEDLNCSPRECIFIAEFLLPHLELGRLPLGFICRRCDKKLGLNAGTALSVVYHYISTGRIKVDLNTPIVGHLPLKINAQNRD